MGATVLLTGATGFVGRHLYPELEERGYDVRCGTRNPERAALEQPRMSWVRFDVFDEGSMRAALTGCEAAFYLVHAMAEGPGYAERERRAAVGFRRAAAESGLKRIVYLGGVAPRGRPSEHLQSRIETGQLLRVGSVPTIELRAGMIIGAGSESWTICRDLASRLPFMILPRWLESCSQPVAIADVVAALAAALEVEIEQSALFDLPGPSTLSAKEILFRIARLKGMRPTAVSVPVLTPKLSSYWLKLVSGADFNIAKELVEGLTHDLVATKASFWDRLPDHTLLPFDEAARLAMAEEPAPALKVRVLERAARLLARRPRD